MDKNMKPDDRYVEPASAEAEAAPKTSKSNHAQRQRVRRDLTSKRPTSSISTESFRAQNPDAISK